MLLGGRQGIVPAAPTMVFARRGASLAAGAGTVFSTECPTGPAWSRSRRVTVRHADVAAAPLPPGAAVIAGVTWGLAGGPEYRPGPAATVTLLRERASVPRTPMC